MMVKVVTINFRLNWMEMDVKSDIFMNIKTLKVTNAILALII